MIRSFIISFIITLCFIFTAHNVNEIDKSFDRCEETLQEIEKSGKYLEILKTHYDF